MKAQKKATTSKPHAFKEKAIPTYQRKTYSDFKALPHPIKLWDGWLFDGVLIYDESGNRYNMNDIKRSWMMDSLINDKLGDVGTISIMKNKLEEQKQLHKPPKVCLMYEQPDGEIIEKIFNLVEE